MRRTERRPAFVALLGVLLGAVAWAPSPAGAAPAEITTVAGGVSSGPARSVNQSPGGIALRGSSLYITDVSRAVVREVDLGTGHERSSSATAHRGSRATEGRPAAPSCTPRSASWWTQPGTC